MSSSLTWLAHSEEERRKTQEVMQLLEAPGTVDEMGMGRIRDALADLLFPGTSTLHTRARYFLFIPWTYKELEAASPTEGSAGKARWREVELISSLKRQSELDGVLPDGSPTDEWGIIGREAGATLVQLPSQAYWNGLLIWGIRTTPGSRDLCHRMLSRANLSRPMLDDDDNPVPGLPGSWWDSHLPEPPPDYKRCATFALRTEEAAYLRERVTTRLAGTALAELLETGKEVDGGRAIWELPEESLGRLSERNRDLIRLAELFSLTMQGASLLYNLMLAEEAERPETVDAFAAKLALWGERLRGDTRAVRHWRGELERFWEVVRARNPRLPSFAERRFVERWSDLAISSGDQLARNPAARELIGDRERHLKGANARLGNRSALQDWGGSSGEARLNFRWAYAANLINDIVAGLARGTESDAQAG